MCLSSARQLKCLRTRIQNRAKNFNMYLGLNKCLNFQKTLLYFRDFTMFCDASCLIHLQGKDTPSIEGYVLFICKTKSRLRRRQCGLARHFKIDPTETIALCFGYAKTLQLTMKALEVALDASAGMNFCLAQLDGSAQVTVMRVIGVAPKLVTSECNRVLRCSYPLPSRCAHLELHISHLKCIKRHSTTPPTDTHMF
jgi:hypothetical protein